MKCVPMPRCHGDTGRACASVSEALSQSYMTITFRPANCRAGNLHARFQGNDSRFPQSI